MMQVQTHSGGARWAPLLMLACFIALAYYFGLQDYFSLQNIAGHRHALHEYVHSHLILALILYGGLYIVVVALSLPVASIVSIAGGFIFGWALSAPVSIIAATIGALIVFQVVKTSIGATVAERAGPLVQKLSNGFATDAFNYLLFLRLVPAFPFFAVNAVAGVCRVNIRTFIIATFLGIIPGSFAFAWLGRGLGSVIDAQTVEHDACVLKDGFNNCRYELSVSSLITWQLLVAFCALGVMALIPVAYKKWKSLQ
jgi:uncharacterized membrane protein YdjX (TVP38/TMEM64 family)